MKAMKIKMPFKLKISRIFANKKFVIAFSLVLSFAIWISVMVNQNPIREKVFTDVTATISIENTAVSNSGLGVVAASSQKFTVTLSGPNYIISTLSQSDFFLSADVSEVTAAGSYALRVYGNRNSSVTGYTFKSIEPSTINVTFDYMDTKELTVKPKLIGASAAEGLIAEDPVVTNTEQSTLTVKGPRTTVEKIAIAESYAEVNETLSATQTFDSYVILKDKDGNVLYRYTPEGYVVDGQDRTVTDNYLTLSYQSLKVTQPISKKVTLPVAAAFTNMPEQMTAKDIPYSIDVEEVTVLGAPDVVNSMKAVTLSPIDLTQVSLASKVFEVSAALKDGVKLTEKIDYFTVTVDLSDYAERTFNLNRDQVKFKDLDSKYTATVDKNVNNVTVCGKKDVILKMTAADLSAQVDLSDKTGGKYTLEVVFTSEKFKDVWQVGKSNIEITIE